MRPGLQRALPVAVAAIVVALVWFVGREGGSPIGFPLDDAWIHMVYGRSLWSEGQVAFNPGVAATGSTSPAWAGCLALAHGLLDRLGTDAVVAGVLVLGASLHVLCVLLACSYVTRATDEAAWGIVAGLCVALAIPLAAASLSGMEVALGAAAMLAALCARQRDWPGRCGLALALAVLARPEATVVAAACCSAFALGRTSPTSRTSRAVSACMAALPGLALGGLWMAYDRATSGRLLPATFYFKDERDLARLGSRLWTGFDGLLGQVPPFLAGVGWVFLAGYLLTTPNRRPWLPLVAGLCYVVSSLYLVDPIDPSAFYHQRYLLPAVPLLVIAAALGAGRIATLLPERVRLLPPLGLLGVSIVGASLTLGPTSRHLHNDVRNIDEVQRRMGEWLAERVPEGAWVATVDAGAVRYFSNHPTVDVMGLNTPDLYWDPERFVLEHPVAAFAIMPAWIQPTHAHDLREYARMETADYTVTSSTAMARQVIVGCAPLGAATRSLVHFDGWRSFALDFIPGALE